MKVKRAALSLHLKKISCNKQIEEAVFEGSFESSPVTEDRQLAIFAPPLEGAEPLAGELGIASISLLLDSLEVLKGDGNEAEFVEIDVIEEGGFQRLLIDEGYRGKLSLVTAHPSAVNSRVGEGGLEKVRKAMPEGDGIPLTGSLINNTVSVFKLFKAEEVELQLGPDGGKMIVGNSHSQMGSFPLPELKAASPFSVLLSRQFIDVISNVTNYAEAALILGDGPRSPIVIRDGAYTFVLSPRVKPSDA